MILLNCISDLRDPTTTPLNFTKSINLALSERGINSLRDAQCPGLLETILADTIPMHSRMIHGRRKVTNEIFEDSQQYDVHGRVCPTMLLVSSITTTDRR